MGAMNLADASTCTRDDQRQPCAHLTLVKPAPLRRGIAALLHAVTCAAPDSTRLLEQAQTRAIMKRWTVQWPSVEAELIDSLATDVKISAAKADRLIAEAGTGIDLLDEDLAALIDRQIPKAWAKGVGRAVSDVVFQVDDVKAQSWLATDNKFWIRDVWSEGLGQRIASVCKGALAEGLGRIGTANLLRDALSQFAEPDHYWRVVSSAGLVRARSYGSIAGFAESGAETFRFLAMMDERTSPICRELDGTIFNVGQGVAHVNAMIETEDPEAVKELAPWVRPSEVMGKSADALADMGVMMPPLHGRCRSRLVVESFS